MPVFRSNQDGSAVKLEHQPFANEKALQNWFERNLESVLGVRFVATEFSTGDKHGGRVDTLGLDEAGNPVIIEYKWGKSESVINQGLFYLDWLVDHRGDFQIACQKALDDPKIEVNWSAPRLIIVAASYSKYDVYAIHQFPRGIELLRYLRYAEGLVVVEAVGNPLSTKSAAKPMPVAQGPAKKAPVEYSLEFHLSKTGDSARQSFLQVRERILELDGVEERCNQKSQVTYRTTRSFCAFAFLSQTVRLQFKGPGVLPADLDPTGRIKNIQSYGWGYPWSCEFNGPDDVEFIVGLAELAYAFEQ